MSTYENWQNVEENKSISVSQVILLLLCGRTNICGSVFKSIKATSMANAVYLIKLYRPNTPMKTSALDPYEFHDGQTYSFSKKRQSSRIKLRSRAFICESRAAEKQRAH
jgi:hypothetical protein